VYLIDGPPMRYNLNLFKFLFSLMESMCFVHEIFEMPGFGWLKFILGISSNGKMNWNKKQYAGKALQEQGHCGTLVPNNVHWFSWSCYKCYDGFEEGMCLCFWTFRCQETLPRDGSLVIGNNGIFGYPNLWLEVDMWQVNFKTILQVGSS